MPKVNKKISYLKCTQCRRDRQKCLPEQRIWPGTRCLRCVRFDYACSASQSVAEEKSTVYPSENTRDSNPCASPAPAHSKSLSQCLQELGDLRQLLDYLQELGHSKWGWKYDRLPEDTLNRLKSQLDDALEEIGRRAKQYQADGKWKDAEFLYRRINGGTQLEAPLKNQTDNDVDVLSNLALVLEEMGDFPAAEVAQEALLATMAARKATDQKALSQALHDLIRLYHLFQERIAPMVVGILDPSVLVLRRAAILDIDFLNSSIIENSPRRQSLDCVVQSPLHIAVMRNATNLTRLLLEKGVNIAQKDAEGWTALHHAVELGHGTIVGLLLAKGAQVNTQDDGGDTSLHIAISEDHETIAQLLLDNGAEVEIGGYDGWTALHLAAYLGRETIVQLLLEKGAKVEVRDVNGDTALHFAVQEGYRTIVQLLHEKGAEVDVVDKYGRTPLSLVRFDDEAMVWLLLEKGARVNGRDNHGRTALHKAVLGAHESTVQLLLENGAEVEVEDHDGATPLSLAVERGDEAVVRLITSKAIHSHPPVSQTSHIVHPSLWSGLG